MSHPVYGNGTPYIVCIGDEVSDRADGVPIGMVVGISDVVAVCLPHGVHYFRPVELCLVKRAEP